MERIYEVTEDDAGLRLDTVLATRVLDVSRSFAQKLIKSHHILINGSPCKPSYILRRGDSIRIELPSDNTAEEENSPKPVAIPLNVLFEDDDIIVLNKPPGLVVHPGAGKKDISLVHGLLAHCESLSQVGAPERPGIVHRLDEGTSGAIVVAKTDRAYWGLIEQFQKRQVSKEYVAIVWGCPKGKSGEIRTLINRHPKNRKKMAVSEHGREAITLWRVARKWDGFSLLNVKILTGRTHQIRVHMAYIHHPVVGDSIYGSHEKRVKQLKEGRLREVLKTIRRQMLHAFRLEFFHPVTHREIKITAPLPDDMQGLIYVLDDVALS